MSVNSNSVHVDIEGEHFDVQQPTESQIELSPLLHQLAELQEAASRVIDKLQDDVINDLSVYYNHALISKRVVVTDVVGEKWRCDLASSLAAVTFARFQVETTSSSNSSIKKTEEDLKEMIMHLRRDVNEPWFQFAVRNARKPTLISMPSLPAMNLGESEERFYVQSVSDSWPAKAVSHVSDNGQKIIISPKASRRFVEGMVAGDLGGEEIVLSHHEQSFLSGHTVGWISRYEQPLRTVTIIEVDPLATSELSINESARRITHELVKVQPQSLDMYNIDMRLHADKSFEDNLVLSRLLSIDQMRKPIELVHDDIDIGTYIHVRGSRHQHFLGPVDEEAFLRCLGSLSAKNKLRSALAISAKARLNALLDRGEIIRNVDTSQSDEARVTKSRMIRCGADGIYVRTRVPYDTIVVLTVTIVLTVWACHTLVSVEGVSSLGEAASLGLALILGISVTYHNIRYNSWPIGQTIRLKRMCYSDEDMQLCMSPEQVTQTIAEAGAKGAGMDGILTCPYSNSTEGKFSVTSPLNLKDAARAGLKIRLSTELRPLWIDLRGVRVVSDDGDRWHAGLKYEDKNYLHLTSSGPGIIG